MQFRDIQYEQYVAHSEAMLQRKTPPLPPHQLGPPPPQVPPASAPGNHAQRSQSVVNVVPLTATATATATGSHLPQGFYQNSRSLLPQGFYQHVRPKGTQIVHEQQAPSVVAAPQQGSLAPPPLAIPRNLSTSGYTRIPQPPGFHNHQYSHQLLPLASNETDSPQVNETLETCTLCGHVTARGVDANKHLTSHRGDLLTGCHFSSLNNCYCPGNCSASEYKHHMLLRHFQFRILNPWKAPLSTMMNHFGICGCGWEGRAKDWLYDHVLSPTNPCPLADVPTRGR